MEPDDQPGEIGAEEIGETHRAGRRCNQKQRALHLVKVAELYANRCPQHIIAEKLGCSAQQVSYDLKVLDGKWRKRHEAAFDTERWRTLEELDRMQWTFWEAWERSREPRHVDTTKQIQDKTVRLEAGIRTEGRDGNPRFLEGVQWCIKERNQMLGFTGPEAANGPAIVTSWAVLSSERQHAFMSNPEAARLYAEARRLLLLRAGGTGGGPVEGQVEAG